MTKIVVFLGNGDGAFPVQMLSLMTYYDNSVEVIVANFNDDELLDIGLIGDDFLIILIGNGNGTFDENVTVSLEYDTSRSVSAVDVNSDGYTDIIVVSSSFDGFTVYYGNADGTFMESPISDNTTNDFEYSLFTSDLNNDNFIDIILLDRTYKTIVTYLGYGNGSFDVKKTSFTGGSADPDDIAIGDFNEDKISDIILTYPAIDALGILYGYSNGTFSERIKLTLNTNISVNYVPLITAVDFNSDGHLDIAICSRYPYILTILYGDGLGSFVQHELFSTENVFGCDTITAGDLNGDGYQDIILTANYTVDIFLSTGRCENISEIDETSTTHSVIL